MIKVKLKENFNFMPELERRLRQLRKEALQVGWFEDQGKHPHSDLSFASVAAINHFGSQRAKIPARPILSVGIIREGASGFRDVKKTLNNLFANIRYKKGNSSFEKNLTVLGREFVKDISSLFGVASSLIPANALSTASRKGKNTPLVDSGSLRDALTFKVEKPRR